MVNCQQNCLLFTTKLFQFSRQMGTIEGCLSCVEQSVGCFCSGNPRYAGGKRQPGYPSRKLFLVQIETVN